MVEYDIYYKGETKMFWFLLFVGLTIFFTWALISSQKEKIKNTIYYEKIIVDRKSRTLQKFKCPSCGNKELDYQISGNSASTIYSKNGRVSTTAINNAKYAICKKCGTSFQTIRKTTPVVNFIVSFAVSLLLCAVGLVIYTIILFFTM